MSGLRATVGKAVHLRVYPRPASLSESREVLRILQQFGEVSMFKSLRFEYNAPAPNICLAIYQHPESAAKLINASPLRFTLEPVPVENPEEFGASVEENQDSDIPTDEKSSLATEMEDPEFKLNDTPSKSGIEEITRPSKLLFDTVASFTKSKEEESLEQETQRSIVDTTPSAEKETSEWIDPSEKDVPLEPEPQPEPATRQREPQPPREFHVIADVSEVNHRDYIDRSMWYGPYNLRSRSAIFSDLVARGAPRGMADIFTDKPEVPNRIVDKLKKEVARRQTLQQIWQNANHFPEKAN